MKVTEKPLESYEQTVDAVWRMAREYWPDLWSWADYSLPAFFEHVHSLPYRSDPKRWRTLSGKIMEAEMISRPAYTVRPEWKGPRDCDDKTALLVPWALARYVVHGEKNPVRIVVSGRGADPHHVYPEFLLRGRWVPAEATYPGRGGLGNRLWPEGFRRVFDPPGGKNAFFGP